MDGHTIQDLLRRRSLWNMEIGDMLAGYDDSGLSKNYKVPLSEEDRIKHQLISEKEILKVSKKIDQNFCQK